METSDGAVKTDLSLLRAFGRRERQDQASSRIGQPGRGCSRRLPQWARRLQGSLRTRGMTLPSCLLRRGGRPAPAGELDAAGDESQDEREKTPADAAQV